MLRVALSILALLGAVFCVPAHAASGYRVGPGDVLKITVYRAPDLETVTAVTESGKIRFPMLGDVEVLELTPNEIADRIAMQLKSAGMYIDPAVNILIVEYHSKVVSVLGAVERPGQYPVDRDPLMVAEVLARAGASFTSNGTIITVLSGSGKDQRKEEFDMASLVGGTRDRALKAGETIFVQAPRTFYISGEVQKAGAYPLEPGMTIGQAIAMAGGLTPRGSASRIRVTHRTSSTSAESSAASVSYDSPVAAGDLIVVAARIF